MIRVQIHNHRFAANDPDPRSGLAAEIAREIRQDCRSFFTTHGSDIQVVVEYPNVLAFGLDETTPVIAEIRLWSWPENFSNRDAKVRHSLEAQVNGALLRVYHPQGISVHVETRLPDDR